MNTVLFAVSSLYADYGLFADGGKYDEWLALFAKDCSYQVMPKENFDRGLPAALIFCNSGECWKTVFRRFKSRANTISYRSSYYWYSAHYGHRVG
jgi:3-phenylpropionate/cinnamic acid dioxygenase small subunit